MFGKKLSDYIRFEWWILVLVGIVWALRLAMSLHGLPFGEVRPVSVNIVLFIGMIYLSIAVHLSRFGSYKQLLGLLLVQNIFAHVLIAAAIILGIVTATNNAFTAPEVFGGNDGKTWFHAVLHLILGGFLAALVGWLIGSGILFLTKRLKPAA